MPPPQMSDYPRDLIGYAGQPPQADWPGGARVAVSLVMNYEEGGERCILHGDNVSETMLTDIDRPDPLPGGRNLLVESNFEYGSRVGVHELLRIFRERGLTVTIYAVGMALRRNPAIGRVFADAGHEVACHADRWTDYHGMDEAAERADIALCRDTIERCVGRAPVGWYTGRPSANTRRLVVEAGGFLYDSDAYNDDLPYWTRVAGRDHLVLPYALDTNDSRMTRGGGFDRGEDFLIYCRDAFDYLHARGGERPAMMSIGLHTRLIGRPGRIGALQTLLDHMQRHEGVWFATREAIARHWMERHPAGK